MSDDTGIGGLGEGAVAAWWARRPAAWCGKTGRYVLTPAAPDTIWLVVCVDFSAPLRVLSTGARITSIVVNGFFYEHMVPDSGPVFITHEFGNTGAHPEGNPNRARVEFCCGRCPKFTTVVDTITRVEDVSDAVSPDDSPDDASPEEHVVACGRCNTAVAPAVDCRAGCSHWYHVACATAFCAVCGFPAEAVMGRRH
jgi:hypothetical protein